MDNSYRQPDIVSIAVLCNLPLHRAEAAWEAYSADLFAGWICLPYDDDKVIAIVKDYV